MKKCSVCGEWVDSFNGVTQYDDDAPVFICDCCFMQTESGQELLANVTAAQQSVQPTGGWYCENGHLNPPVSDLPFCLTCKAPRG